MCRKTDEREFTEEGTSESVIFLCPKCGGPLSKEENAEIDYPLVCLECDENFYQFEAVLEG